MRISDAVGSRRGSEISEGGMTLYVEIHLEPGDSMELQFEIPSRNPGGSGTVRSRVGYSFGLEFLTPLLAGDRSGEAQQQESSADKLPVRMVDTYGY
jgi:hypothetical protein